MSTTKTTPDYIVTDVYQKSVYTKNPVLNVDNYFPATQKWTGNRSQLTGDVPGWRTLVAQGRNATTSLSGTRFKVQSRAAYCDLTITNGPNLLPNHPSWEKSFHSVRGPGVVAYALPPAASHASLVNAESRAMEGFLQACQRSMSSFQGGVFIAELAKAVHGIRHPAEALKDYLKWHAMAAKQLRARLRKIGRSNGSISQAIAQLWLEKQYHWGPLANDFESAAESLAVAGSRDDVQNVSFEGFDDYASDSGFNFRTWSPISVRFVVRYSESCRCRFYGAVAASCDASSSAAGFLERGFGLSLSQALPTLWELIPFSCVADYFSNTGALISAYSFPTSRIRWVNRGTRSVTVNLVTNVVFPHTPSSSSQTYEYGAENPGFYRAERSVLLRTPYDPSDLIPGFRLSVPGISDWPKWLNLGALAHVISS